MNSDLISLGPSLTICKMGTMKAAPHRSAGKFKQTHLHLTQQFHPWEHTWKKKDNSNLKRYMHLNAHSSTVYNSQDMEATQVSLNKQIMKMWYMYMMDYYSAIKKNEMLAFAATGLGLENIMLSGINQTEKDKYCMMSLMCGI